MIRRILGSTDMTISAVGLGAFAMGGWMWGTQQESDSEAAIRTALDAGVNWIDTAPIYGSGVADRVVGRVLAGIPAAQRPLVFTKFGHHLVDGQRVSDGSRARVVADCDYALKTFGVERLDLFQLHWPAPQPVAETAAACGELLQAGKIRAIGVSNVDVAFLDAWRATGVPLHAVQNAYSLMKRQAADAVLPWCAEHGVGFLAYSPLQRGLLTGTWGPDKAFPAGDHRGQRPEYTGEGLVRALALVERLRAIAEEDDLTVAQLAIGYLMCTEGLTASIVGARNAAQAAQLADYGMPLRQVQLDAIDQALVEHGF